LVKKYLVNILTVTRAGGETSVRQESSTIVEDHDLHPTGQNFGALKIDQIVKNISSVI
jgi:hypothetical protein